MRPLRIRLPNGWHHVINRGLNRMPLFLDDRDRENRVERLGELPARFGVVVHAYALMDNHDHYLLQVPRNNLDAAMQWFNAGYGIWFNRRHQRLGPAFSSPYKAILVQSDGSWALDLSRYVHLNPIRTAALELDKSVRAQEKRGGTPPPSSAMVARRLQVLREFRWSSYGPYAGYRAVPPWLTTAELWRRLGGTPKTAASAYRKYVEDYVRQHAEQIPEESAPERSAIGSTEFIDGLRPLAKGDRREQPELRRWDSPHSFSAVVKAVEMAKGENWNEFRDRHGDPARDLVLHLARRHSGLTLRQIGDNVGGLHYVAVSNAVRRIGKRLRENRRLQELEKAAEAQLLNV